MAKKQKALPGMEKETIAEVDDAAEQYVKERDKRMTMTEKEVEAKQALIYVMRKHKLTVYKDDNVDPPLIVTLADGKPVVKVTRDESDEAAAEALSA
jgi:hypothetical protein